MINWKQILKQLGFFGILHALYLLLLAVYLANNLYWAYPLKSFVWAFWASQGDLIQWFPNYHYWVWVARVGFLVVGVMGLRFLTRNWKMIRPKLRFNQHSKIEPFVLQESIVLLAGLVLYLMLYGFSESKLEEEIGFRFQIWLSRGWLLQLVVQAILALTVHYRFVKTRFKRFLLVPQPPHGLAVLRILFALWCIWVYKDKINTVLPTVSLPFKVPLPGYEWVIDWIPINADLYTTISWIGIVSCLLVIVGLKTRFALVINAICCLYLIAAPNFFGKLWHEQLLIWVSWFFALSRCFDAFSVDAFLKKNKAVRSPNYAFPIRLIWLQLAVIYFWAGFYKFWDCGFDWALDSSMINQVQLEWLQHYDTVPSIRVDNYPGLLHAAGLLVVLFELGYVLLILKRKWRWIAVFGALIMHNVFGWLLYIPFYVLQVFYVSYIDFNKLIPKRLKDFKVTENYSKPALYTGLVIIAINFSFGLFSIDTYPFSAYPKYAAIVPDTIGVIHFEAYCDGKLLDVHTVGKQNKFRWESYGWLEHGIITDHSAGNQVELRVSEYWQIWACHNPQLNHCDSVKAFLVERPVSPEGKEKAKTIGLISKVLP